LFRQGSSPVGRSGRHDYDRQVKTLNVDQNPEFRRNSAVRWRVEMSGRPQEKQELVLQETRIVFSPHFRFRWPAFGRETGFFWRRKVN
jgi:hypothetical protein